MSETLLTGGCQCGAVRYSVTGLGRASICHCRMCQKAFGNVFAPLVTAIGLNWTRGAPKHFQSSNKVKRGFCADCGTPLTYQFASFGAEIAICTFDDPAKIPPVIQVGLESTIPWCEDLAALPARTPGEVAKVASIYEGMISYQHPDFDTADWKHKS